MTKKVVECGACGRPFPTMVKLTLHIGRAHKGKVVSAIVKEK